MNKFQSDEILYSITVDGTPICAVKMVSSVLHCIFSFACNCGARSMCILAGIDRWTRQIEETLEDDLCAPPQNALHTIPLSKVIEVTGLTVEPSRASFFFVPAPFNAKSVVRCSVSPVFTGEAPMSTPAILVPPLLHATCGQAKL